MPSASIEHECIVDRLVSEGADKFDLNSKLAWACLTASTDYPGAWPSKPTTQADADELTRSQLFKLQFHETRGELMSSHSKVPDAFRIEPDPTGGGKLTIYEVVKTSDVKPADYCRLWWWCDCEEWAVRLEVISHHGGVMGVYGEEELTALFYEQQFKEAPRG